MSQIVLSKLKSISTLDSKTIHISDFYINLEKLKVDYFVCKVGNLVKKSEILVSSVLADYDNLNAQLYINTSYKKVKRFQHKDEIRTSFDEYLRSTSYNQDSLSNGLFLYNGPIDSIDPMSESKREDQSHVYSYKKLTGYFVDSPDHLYGTLYDFIINSDTFDITHTIVNLSGVLNKDLRILAAPLIREVNHPSGTIYINLRNVRPHSLLHFVDRAYSGLDEYRQLDVI